jgi:3-deoxy-manno-octulosonate cytidylyltransferase (CMP-KDO synthetase)
MELKVLGVIPARYASSRFPGKPLAMIGDKSMIQRVYGQVSQCRSFNKILVATDDLRIFDHVKEFGGEVIMTSENHLSGTERIGEVVEASKAQDGRDLFNIIVNIQGDEPLINPEQLLQVISCFSDDSIQISTLMRTITSTEELFNPAVVKVIVDSNMDALYFSRSVIPYERDLPSQNWAGSGHFNKHVGLYAYRIDVLRKIIRLSPSLLERSESLEQLRWIENGFKIKVMPTEYETISVDRPEDLLKFTNILT